MNETFDPTNVTFIYTGSRDPVTNEFLFTIQDLVDSVATNLNHRVLIVSFAYCFLTFFAGWLMEQKKISLKAYKSFLYWTNTYYLSVMIVLFTYYMLMVKAW